MKRLKLDNKKISFHNKYMFLLALIIGLLLIVVFGAFYYKHEYKLVNYKGDYQAVFLTNGQVYFGHIIRENENSIVLDDVYYLKMNQDLQNNQDKEDKNNLSLVKLGSELHGPTGRMYIVRDNVLFTEDLKQDSQVVKAILDYSK